MIWRTGMTGTTRAGLAFRVIADDAAGLAGPLVVLVKSGDTELTVRLPRNGVHRDSQSHDLMPPRVARRPLAEASS